MTPSHGVRTFRRLGIVAATTGVWAAACLGLCWAAGEAVRDVRRPGAADFDDLLVLSAAAVAAGLLTWIALGAVATALTLARQGSRRAARHVATHLTPGVVHRVVATMLGITVAGTTAAGPALAGPRANDAVLAAAFAQADGRPSADSREAMWLPDLDRAGGEGRWVPAPPPRSRGVAAERAVPLVTAVPRAASAAEDEVVVRRGDTLWDIAARHLGPGASAEEIAREWPRWYAANSSVIGPDPDVLFPGQLLQPPA